MGSSTMISLVLSCCLLLAHSAIADDAAAGRCAMNGQCATLQSSVGMEIPVPCAVDQDPKVVDKSKLSQQEIEDFQTLCAAYANFTSPDTKLCCDVCCSSTS